MTEEELSVRLEGRRLGACLDCHDRLDSTNNRARQLAERGYPEGTLVTAETQTAGKGRRGRVWVSPPGTGLWFSLILRPAAPAARAPVLTLAAALSVAEAAEEVCGLAAGIKWPNDIVISGRKVCGILTEMRAEADRVRYVIVGIGVNVNTADFPEEIRATATSLYLESGARVDRGRLLAAVMERMEHWYGLFLRTFDMTLLREAYTARLLNLNRESVIEENGSVLRGRCLGIDDEGLLLIGTEDGAVQKVRSGEVSVRGIYGYV